ncbi:MAG TPA: isoprenylcysteine carboxylmethyltransferase family protein [Gemmatimonadaceae bacterium]|nr:isoprenylcysteine carboxylmethyltransferase family protein [Gemmatimonadaceae bacterium]
MSPEILATTIVVLSWVAFTIVMGRRPRPPASPPAAGAPLAKRDRRSVIGIALQFVALAIVWSPPRYGIARVIERAQGASHGLLLAVWLGVIAAFMVAGVALARAAILTLGKQWTLVATVASDHALVTSGPYARVRHPIYSALLLLLLGTGLAMSGWLQIVLGVVSFSIGTAQRVRLEERLLAETHGAEFQAYRTTVPAVLPRLVGRDPTTHRPSH